MLLFSTVRLNLKTVGKWSAATDLTHSLSIHKTGNTKTKKHSYSVQSYTHFIFIMSKMKIRNIHIIIF